MELAKYIVVEIQSGVSTFETPIIFPYCIGHDDMAKQLGIDQDKVISGGFVEFSAREHLYCGLPYSVVESTTLGESISLGVKSRPSDAHLIDQALKLGE
jgi:hypothetical protein